MTFKNDLCPTKSRVELLPPKGIEALANSHSVKYERNRHQLSIIKPKRLRLSIEAIGMMFV
jgi:hypothetical protein